MYYDKIFVMDNGKVVQSGTPENLLKSEGPFKELVGDKLDNLKKEFYKDN